MSEQLCLNLEELPKQYRIENYTNEDYGGKGKTIFVESDYEDKGKKLYCSMVYVFAEKSKDRTIRPSKVELLKYGFCLEKVIAKTKWEVLGNKKIPPWIYEKPGDVPEEAIVKIWKDQKEVLLKKIRSISEKDKSLLYDQFFEDIERPLDGCFL